MDHSIVFMCAGLSSRFNGKIKQFAEVGPNNESLIEYSMNQSIRAGFNQIIFIVGKKTEVPFKLKFGNNYKGIPVRYAYQDYDPSKRDKPWGTTDALCSAKHLITGPFVVCNGDDIYGTETFQILKNHLIDKEEDAAIGYKLAEILPEKGKVHRAIFQINEDNYLTDIIETFNLEISNLEFNKVKPDDFASMNTFALQPDSLKKLNTHLENFKQKNQNDLKIEALLPNDIAHLIRTNQIKMKIYPSKSKWLGITNPEDELIVRKTLKILNYSF